MLAQTLVDPVADHPSPTPHADAASGATPRAPHPSWHALPWRWVSADWLNALSADWVAALSLSALAQLSRLTCAGLAPDFVRALSPLQLAALFHVEALSPAAVAVLTPAQVSALPQTGRWLDADWINALDDAALAAMTPDQLGDLGACTLAGLSPRVLRLMSAEQRLALPGAAAIGGAMVEEPVAGASAARAATPDHREADAAAVETTAARVPPADVDGAVASVPVPASVPASASASTSAFTGIPVLTDETSLTLPEARDAPVEAVAPVAPPGADLAEEDWLAAGLECLDGPVPVAVDGCASGGSAAVEDQAVEATVAHIVEQTMEPTAEPTVAQVAVALAPASASASASAGPPDGSSGDPSDDVPVAWGPVILDPRLRPRAPYAGRNERSAATRARPPGRLPVISRSMAARWRALVSPSRPGLRIARVGLAAGRRLDAWPGSAAWADPPLAERRGDAIAMAGPWSASASVLSWSGPETVGPGGLAPPGHGLSWRPLAGIGQPVVRAGGPPGQGGWCLMACGPERMPPPAARAA
ncbi:MAG: hypothetical protein RIQ53_3946, partial [Pseudomonadota bacterium]